MPILFACACGKPLQVREEYAGRRVRCPACGREQTAPAGGAAIKPVSPPPEPPPEVPAPRERVTPRPAEVFEPEGPPRRRRRPERGEPGGERRKAGTSGKALASLILGVASFCVPFLPAVAGVILAILGLRDVRRSQGRLAGQGLAIGGLITSLVSMVLWVPALLIALLVPAVQKVREAAGRPQSGKNLQVIALGIINYSDAHGGRMPPPVVYDERGNPLYGWRVLILPYIEQDNLYREFHLDEPWNGANNLKLLSRMPAAYGNIGDPKGTAEFATHYQVLLDRLAAFDDDPGGYPKQNFNVDLAKMQLFTHGPATRFPASFTDGTSNTFLVVEAEQAVPWTKPQDLRLFAGPLPRFGRFWNGGFMAALADGSTVFVPGDTPEATIRAYCTARGNEIVPPLGTK